jgi:hypothetical protein
MIRAARELMEVYRSEAAAIAEKRAIHLDACGERRAATTWRQIGDAVCGPSKPKTRRAVQAAPRRYAARQRLTSFKRATSRSGKRPCGVSRKRSITAQRARVVATSRPPAGLNVSIRLSRNQKPFVEHAASLETLCDSSPRITSWRVWRLTRTRGSLRTFPLGCAAVRPFRPDRRGRAGGWKLTETDYVERRSRTL